MHKTSLWLSEIEADLKAPTPLQGSIRADIAILGGGFVGLWTAINLKQLEPSRRVAVLEMGNCGSGASGMNGGFAMSWWPKIGSLIRLCGEDDAAWLAEETVNTLEDLPKILERYDVDAEVRLNGWLWTATTPAHTHAWDSVVTATHKLGRGNVFESLSPQEIVKRTGSDRHIAGVYERLNGTVHPGKLGRGLFKIARALGVEIYEHTPVERFNRRSPVQIITPHGQVTAEKLIITTNAWAATVPELARQFVCVGSSIVATPPIPERLQALGWTGGESITDSQTTVNFYRTTRSGRLVFGKGGGHLYYTGKPPQIAFHNPKALEETIMDFRRVYPSLADVPIDRGWSGPIDRTYDSLPVIGYLHDAPHISYGIGWSGNGVNPSRVGGRILAGMALQYRERWTENGLVGRKAKSFPPEPFRYVGGSMVRAAMLRKDQCEISGTRVSLFDKFLNQFAPAGLEDKR